MDSASLTALIDALGGRTVAVIGDVVADEFVYGRVARVSREAPVLILEYDSTEIVPGAGGNAANNVAALGGRATLVSVIGRDDAGRRLVAALHPRVRSTAVARAVADDPRRAVRLRGVVDVERSIARVAGRERHPQQTLLASVLDERADVEEGTRRHPAPLDDADPPGLLDDVQTAGLARRLHDIHGAVEATGDGHEPNGRRAGGERAADRDRAAGDRQKERDAGHPARIAAAARRPANGARLRPA